MPCEICEGKKGYVLAPAGAVKRQDWQRRCKHGQLVIVKARPHSPKARPPRPAKPYLPLIGQ